MITQVGNTFVNETFAPTDNHTFGTNEINIGGLWNDLQLSFACNVQQKNVYKIKFEYSYFNTETHEKHIIVVTDIIDKFFEEYKITENGLWFSKMKIYPLPWESNAKLRFLQIESTVTEYKARPTVSQFPLDRKSVV